MPEEIKEETKQSEERPNDSGDPFKIMPPPLKEKVWRGGFVPGFREALGVRSNPSKNENNRNPN